MNTAWEMSNQAVFFQLSLLFQFLEPRFLYDVYKLTNYAHDLVCCFSVLAQKIMQCKNIAMYQIEKKIFFP